ncbi:XRE family transcriptional regulator [Actinokineospora inagensis]|uniref:XRE family transcriptional regulator n=1 Tax=Actinokineospora inagensis TaxID=103730 RepID=UPI001FE0CD7D|nr:XRE family transcriptional regulator [Actinokineospora inagensis]
MTANYIGKLERGLIKWPQRDYREGLRAVLGAGTDAELGFTRNQLTTANVEDVNRSEFLRTSVGVVAGALVTPLTWPPLNSRPIPVPVAVGPGDIEAVRIAARLFGAWDHTYGGGVVRQAVAAQLQHSAGLLNARCDPSLREELFGAVGYLGHTSAFMAFDAYAHDDARNMFRFALACAEEADNWHLRAKVLSSMARQEIWCDNPDSGLTLIELAMVRSDRLTATERAMLLTARARALAKLGRVSDTVRTIGLADEQFSQAEPANDPAWMAYYDAAQHYGDTGHALFDLAVHGRFGNEAASRLDAAVRGHTEPYARSRAISGIKLASLTMRIGDPDQAAQIGARALAEADTITSRRASDDLRELSGFAQRHGRREDVQELRSAIHHRLKIAPR